VHNFSKRRNAGRQTKDFFPTFESFSRTRKAEDNPQAELDLLTSGTGTIVSPDGHLITAAHVVPRSSRAMALFRGRMFETKVVARLHDEDALLLKLVATTKEKFPYAQIVACEYELGQPVFFLGYPIPDSLGIHPRFTETYVNSKEGYCDDQSRFTIIADAANGSSGSAAFNRRGHVIGIVSASIFAAGRDANKFPRDLCFCVKSKTFLDKFSKHLPPQKTAKTQKRDRQEIINAAAETSVLISAFSNTRRGK
jgi:S1-C subfamily serine protease